MENYKNMLDLTFELEGLVRLRCDREADKALDAHIIDKLKEINDLAGLPNETVVEKTVEVEIEKIVEKPVVVEKIVEKIIEKPVEVSSMKPETTDAAQDEDDSMFYALDDDEDDDDDSREEETEEEESPAEPEREIKSETPKRAKPLISINDRFRFKRELFGNSDKAFNEALTLLTSMESAEEARDYFLNETDWDPERDVVVEFFDMAERYFKTSASGVNK